MKKQTVYLLITALLCTLILIPAALADDCCPSDKTSQIDHRSEVDGYHLEYQFIDMMEKMKAMTEMDHSMAGMTATHHLMVFIKTGKGETVRADQVGFLITGPGGGDQKAMAMGMGSGYGADVNLSLPGEYTVKTKALIGEKNLLDSFSYTILQP